MRKIFVCIAFVILAFSLTAWAEEADHDTAINVVGSWTLDGHIVSVDGYNPVNTTMDITDQEGSLFRGHLNPVDPNDPEQHTNFYGAVVDQKIYLTFLDTTVEGTIYRHGKKVDFVAQQIEYDPSHRHPGTFIGTATKN